MGGNNGDVHSSYDRHSYNEARVAEEERLPSCYSMPNSVDNWRHRRMHALILPIIRTAPDTTWLTVGDGNFASDAHFLYKEGIDVTASSLTTSSLQIAKSRGYVPHVVSINAEQIPFDDDSFDFVLCKEAFHHFPRPPLAFYEMLRVAKVGVILIEPQESRQRLLSWLKVILKRILRGDKNSECFEETGNFIYRVSELEVAKMLTALNYNSFAIRRFNDSYLPWTARSNQRPRSLGYFITFAAIVAQDLLCMARLLDHGLACIISFKQPLHSGMRRALNEAGYNVRVLPVNPYL